MNTKQVSYDREFINLLSNLSRINDKFLIEKSEDEKNISIKCRNEDRTVAFILIAGVDNFDFEGNEVGFYKFSEFNSLMKVFSEPILIQDNNTFEIVKDKSKITYHTANPEIIQDRFKRAKFDSPDLVFDLSSEQLSELSKMTSLLGHGKKGNIQFHLDEKFVIKILGDGKEENAYEKEYQIKEKKVERLSMLTPKDVFELAPKGDYEVQIKTEGVIKFKLKNDKYSLEIFTAENED